MGGWKGTISIDPQGNITGNVQPVTPPNPTPTPPAWADPASVLVVMNDNTGPEFATNGVNASLFVAQHYMAARKIPAGNLVHTATFIEDGSGASCIPGGPRPHDPGTFLACNYAHPSSVHISDALYQSEIAAPVKAALTSKIRYIVPVYGVPTTIMSAPGVVKCSVDTALAALLQANSGQVALSSPFYGSTVHIDASASKVLLVSRLDGPDAQHAAALVDKAIAGEGGVKGIGYFDYGPTAPLGGTTLNAYNLCVAAGPSQPPVLNDQSVTGHMIQSAPNTAWAWGGYNAYDTGPLWNAYSFVSGAVATSMNSASAQSIRSPSPGAVVSFFLVNGVTATWGAVAEPGEQGYATGDILLNALWHGFTFGEAAYIACPWLNWMMTMVGDPLYRPTLK